MPSGSARVLTPRGARQDQRGFTYVWILMALALLALWLSAVSERWSDQVKRQREAELIRIGTLYATAISKYYAGSPGSVQEFPTDLHSLVEDRRTVGTTRYLRTLYADPVNPSQPFGLIQRPDGAIIGVYSQSSEEPLRKAALDLGVLTLPAAAHYSDWQFIPKVVP